MKSISPALQSHLNSGTTTLCWCWKITRADGVMLGFTDHDLPLVFDALRYDAASGFTASEVAAGLDLSVDNLTVAGALSAASLNEADLAAGLFDHAGIEIWRVNWADPSLRLLLRKGVLGEVTRGKTGFVAEMRGLTEALNQPVGRVFGHSCDAELGDRRCTVALSAAAASVTAVIDSRRFLVSGLSAYAASWFAAGTLAVTSGATQGRLAQIKRHTLTGGVAGLELWQALSEPVAVGDSVTVTPGCDKQFASCKAKFANAVHFRGHPYMPGTGVAFAAVSSSTPLDGGSRYGN